MKYVTGLIVLLVLAGVIVLVSGGFHSWQHDKTVGGVEYERLRYEHGDVDQGIRSIGYLAQQVEINGLVYKGWLHRRDDETILGGMLAEDAVVDEISLPADTWVSFDRKDRLVSCHFPSNQTIQGFTCYGTGGGSKGAVVSFYPGGRLKQFFAPRDVHIQDIPCRGGLFVSVHLYENGRLKQCTLAEATELDGTGRKRGARIELDEDGKLAP